MGRERHGREGWRGEAGSKAAPPGSGAAGCLDPSPLPSGTQLPCCTAELRQRHFPRQPSCPAPRGQGAHRTPPHRCPPPAPPQPPGFTPLPGCPAPAAHQPGQTDRPCAAGTSCTPSPRRKGAARWDAGRGAAPAIQGVMPPHSCHLHLPPEELPPPCPKSPLGAQPQQHLPLSSPSTTSSQRHGEHGGRLAPAWAAEVLLGATAPLPPWSPESLPIPMPGVDGDAGHGTAALIELLPPCGLG